MPQARAKVEASVRSGIALAVGVEFEDRAADFAGSVPVASHDNAPDARVSATYRPGEHLTSERLPNYSRLDLSAYALRRFRPGNLTVFFVSLMNALDAANVRDYRYTGDYSERIPLKTPFPRTLYFGVTTTLPF